MQAHKLQMMSEKLTLRNYILVGLSILLLAMLPLLWMLRMLRNKNRKMVALMIEYNNRTKQKADLLCEKARGGGFLDSQTTDLQTINTNTTELTPRQKKEDALFQNFDRQVRDERIYLNYQFTRDDYAKLMGTDRNRFAQIIKDHTGGNLNTYLNDMRLNYSISLFRMHPDWPMGKIAQESALPSLSTFYRLFKEKYGISPSTFKTRLKKTKNTDNES